MKNADMPAMPELHRDPFGNYHKKGGLTKREMFAMHAMQGIQACAGQDMNYEQEAVQAVQCADALLKELEK